MPRSRQNSDTSARVALRNLAAREAIITAAKQFTPEALCSPLGQSSNRRTNSGIQCCSDNCVRGLLKCELKKLRRHLDLQPRRGLNRLSEYRTRSERIEIQRNCLACW